MLKRKKLILKIILFFILNIIFFNKNNMVFSKQNNSFLKKIIPSLQRQPFYGIHQSGITTPQQEFVVLASFDIFAHNKNELKNLFIILTNRIRSLTYGSKISLLENNQMPPIDSGMLGKIIFPDNMTITMSVGSSIFDDRFGLKKLKPIQLKEMNHFPNDFLNSKLCHGDILLQICANTKETTIHALRDIIKYSSGLLGLKWKQEGFISHNSVKNKKTPINLLGFKDGTANPDPKNENLMNNILWIDSKNKEPFWSWGGTYQVIRIIRFKVEFWDRTPLHEQQKIFGRKKYTGAPLYMKNEFDIPNYYNDPNGNLTPLNSHIRLANPRISDKNFQILRRGYNYSNGIYSTGNLDMGLLFVCFQNDLEKGFINIQNRLNGEDLEEYIQPIGGGYFFILPGILDSQSYLGKTLIESN